jgi:hypothetical protein
MNKDGLAILDEVAFGNLPRDALLIDHMLFNAFI